MKKKDKRAPAEIRNEICHIPENLSSGKMVALRLVKYFDEIPQIGKVVSVSDMEVTIEWFIGSYSDVWISWKRNNKVVKETVPKNAVIYSDIDLTKSSRLKPSTRKALQELYEIKELI